MYVYSCSRRRKSADPDFGAPTPTPPLKRWLPAARRQRPVKSWPPVQSFQPSPSRCECSCCHTHTQTNKKKRNYNCPPPKKTRKTHTFDPYYLPLLCLVVFPSNIWIVRSSSFPFRLPLRRYTPPITFTSSVVLFRLHRPNRFVSVCSVCCVCV
jgi:hypothetical protein